MYVPYGTLFFLLFFFFFLVSTSSTKAFSRLSDLPTNLATNTKTGQFEATAPSQTTLHSSLTKKLLSGLLDLLLDKAVLVLNRLGLCNSTKTKALNNILLALAVQAIITLVSGKVLDCVGIVKFIGVAGTGGSGVICDTLGVLLGNSGLEELRNASFLVDTASDTAFLADTSNTAFLADISSTAFVDGTSSTAFILAILLLSLLVLALEDAGAAETDGASHDRVNFQRTRIGSLEAESASLWRVEDDGSVRHITRTRTGD